MAAIRNQAPRQLELETRCHRAQLVVHTACCCSVGGGTRESSGSSSWFPVTKVRPLLDSIQGSSSPHQHLPQRAPESHTPWGSAPGPLSGRTGHADFKDGGLEIRTLLLRQRAPADVRQESGAQKLVFGQGAGIRTAYCGCARPGIGAVE